MTDQILQEMAWAMQARDSGEPICRDVEPEPYFLDMADAAFAEIIGGGWQVLPKARGEAA